MYSASLTGAIFHTIPDARGDSRLPSPYKQQSDVAAILEVLLERNPAAGRFEIPVVGRSTFASLGRLSDSMRQHLTIDDEQLTAIFWGRVPTEVLIRHFRTSAESPAKEEYLDLGTPLRPSQSAVRGIEGDCAQLVALTATKTPRVGAAIIDRGKYCPGQSPNDFDGKLRHANTTDIEFGLHALQVLWVLLDRLNSNGAIAETRIACALVREPSTPIGGLSCFDNANATELLDAMKELRRMLYASSTPWAINLSLGTHVGPHNGQSPLEEYVARLSRDGQPRFLVAAAGNDGLSGVAARRELVANVRDYLNVRVGPNKPKEVFVELWWEGDPTASARMIVEVMPSDRSGNQLLTGPMRISDGTVGSSLAANHPGFGGHVVQTLFQTNVHNNMSCAAFTVSARGGLPVLDLEIAMQAAADVVVNAWIVVCLDPLTAFVGASSESTIAVPSTAAEAVCVAGVESSGQPWARSSRGPAANYSLRKNAPAGAPHLAYLVAPGHSGSDGTSFAAPRVTADAANALKDPARARNCSSPSRLAVELLRVPAGGKSRQWNPRTGHGERST